MKKFIAIATVAAFALSAGTAFAFYPMYPMSSSDITVSTGNYGTTVGNNVVTAANTGDNSASKGLIITGDAFASSYAGNEVNSTAVKVSAPCEGCNGDINVSTTNIGTTVGNNVVTAANTGDNSTISGPQFPMPCMYQQSSSGGMIITGNATSVAEAINVVNSSVVRIRR